MENSLFFCKPDRPEGYYWVQLKPFSKCNPVWKIAHFTNRKKVYDFENDVIYWELNKQQFIRDSDFLRIDENMIDREYDDGGLYRFKYKPTGQWIRFENGPWVLTDEPTEIYDVYQYVNEIMEDLKCEFDDIEIIYENLPYRYSERDFPEDYSSNNENDFICHCSHCGNYFHGHGKRKVCKVCEPNNLNLD